MSKSSSVDKYEPIKLDTTILKIDVKTEGDLITKDYDLIPFHPNMADMKDLSNNNYILFPSFVKITMKYLKNAGVGQDFKKVFTNLEKYIDLIKYLTKDDKVIEEDYTLLVDQTQYKNYAMSFVQDFTSDITEDFRSVQKYEPLTDQEIITNNIGIIKSIFLPKNGRFFVLGHEYIINESKYVPPYVPSNALNEKLTERKNVPLNYTITVELQLLDVALNPGMGDFSKLSCKQKKINLNKDVKEIFGQEFGYKEEIKAPLPPLVPTSTSPKRRFGKLQLEWEERNKYVKAATTENERIAQEKNWSPLQKKIAQLDKIQEDINKIPPLWIKEQKELTLKYDTFDTEMKKYVEELRDIDRVNASDVDNSLVRDQKDTVLTKMKDTIDQLVVVNDNLLEVKYATRVSNKIKEKESASIIPDKAALLKQLIREDNEAIIKPLLISPPSDKDINSVNLKSLIESYNLSKTDELLQQIVDLKKAIDLINAFIRNTPFNKKNDDYYKLEQDEIDYRNVKPFIKDMEEKGKDVRELKNENEKINGQIKELQLKGDNYAIKAKEEERAKVQAILLKKQTDYQSLKTKYGDNGKTLVTKWKESLDKMNTLKGNIDLDKTTGEQKILNDSVTLELNAKLKEIKELKKLLYKAKYFAGEYAEITKKEGNEFSKKPGERPIENVNDIENNITNLEDEYLEIANKLGSFNKLQSYITILNDDTERIKVLKKGKETEKDDKEKEVKRIVKELADLSRIYNSEQLQSKSLETELATKTSELDKLKTTDETKNADKIKELGKKIDEIKTKIEANSKNDNEAREKDLKAEQEKLQKKIKPLTFKVDLLKLYEKTYNEIITNLKKRDPKQPKDDIKIIQEYLKKLREKYLDQFNQIDTDNSYTFDKDLFKTDKAKNPIVNPVVPPSSVGGSKKKTRRKTIRDKFLKKKYTKRFLNKRKIKDNRSLRKRRCHGRKKRYTIRR